MKFRSSGRAYNPGFSRQADMSWAGPQSFKVQQFILKSQIMCGFASMWSWIKQEESKTKHWRVNLMAPSRCKWLWRGKPVWWSNSDRNLIVHVRCLLQTIWILWRCQDDTYSVGELQCEKSSNHNVTSLKVLRCAFEFLMMKHRNERPQHKHTINKNKQQ